MARAADLGRFAVSDCVETVQQMLDQGLMRWVPGENRIEFPRVPRTAAGEVIH